ncbi:MAG TPA: segregation/condensation protein A [Opitutaceae bacterium]
MVAVVAESDHRIKLQVFEGPLDLLLFLIRKDELDIHDIPIVEVTRQYLDALYAMKEMSIEVAGEFFVMAATLMEIKSRMLLPRHQRAVDPNAADDDLVDPRWELVHQLIQYKKFKDAAGELGALIAARQDMLERESALIMSAADRPLRPSDKVELWNSFNQVLRRLAEKLVVGEISDDHVTVVDQMELIMARTRSGESSFTFSSILGERTTLRTLISTFLAILELARLNRIRVRQDALFSDFICDVVPETSTAGTEAPSLLSEQP